MTSEQEQFILDNLSVPKTGPKNVVSPEMAMALLNCASGLTKEITQRLKVRRANGSLCSLYKWGGYVIEEDASGLMYGKWN